MTVLFVVDSYSEIVEKVDGFVRSGATKLWGETFKTAHLVVGIQDFEEAVPNEVQDFAALSDDDAVAIVAALRGGQGARAN